MNLVATLCFLFLFLGTLLRFSGAVQNDPASPLSDLDDDIPQSPGYGFNDDQLDTLYEGLIIRFPWVYFESYANANDSAWVLDDQWVAPFIRTLTAQWCADTSREERLVAHYYPRGLRYNMRTISAGRVIVATMHAERYVPMADLNAALHFCLLDANRTVDNLPRRYHNIPPHSPWYRQPFYFFRGFYDNVRKGLENGMILVISSQEVGAASLTASLPSASIRAKPHHQFMGKLESLTNCFRPAANQD